MLFCCVWQKLDTIKSLVGSRAVWAAQTFTQTDFSLPRGFTGELAARQICTQKVCAVLTAQHPYWTALETAHFLRIS